MNAPGAPVSSQANELPGLRRLGRAGRTLLEAPDLRVLAVCSVLLGLSNSFVLPFMSLFGTLEVGMSLAAFGGFMTATTLVNVCIGTLLSHWSDRLPSRRPLLLLGAASGVLGYTGYAFAREPWVLLGVGAVFLGVASISFSQLFAHARERLALSRAAPEEAPLFMNAFRMAYAAAWTLGPAVAAFVLSQFRFRGLFLGAALCLLVFFVLVLGFVEGAPKGTPVTTLPATPPSAPPAKQRLALWAAPEVLPWFIAFVLLFAAQAISMSNMSLYVVHVLGGVEGHVGVIFSLAPIFEVPFMIYVGLLATRMDAQILIRLAILLQVVYFGALALVQAPWHIYPLQALSAAIVAVTSGVAITFFQNKLPGHLGAATNLFVNSMRLGATSGYLLFGTLASGLGHRATFTACAGLSAAALLATAVPARRPP